MIGEGPWFYHHALEEGDIVELYGCGVWSPGGLWVKWTDSWSWRTQFACDHDYLDIYHDRPCIKARVQFARKARNVIQRMRSHAYKTNCEMFCYQMYRYMDYLATLNCIPGSSIDEWSVM